MRKMAGRSSCRAELGKRLGEVDKGYRKPSSMTFSAFSEKYLTEYLPGKGRKRSTVIDYTSTIRNHLEPAFGDVPLSGCRFKRTSSITMSRGRCGTASRRRRSGTIWRCSTRCSGRPGVEVRHVNPIDDVEPPNVPEPETRIYDDGEVAELLTALRQLEGAPPPKTDAAWWSITRRMVIVALGTGLRRGELLGLRWQDVDLLEQGLRVEQQIVRGEVTTPKSRAGRRMIDYGPIVRAGEIEEQWQATVVPSRRGARLRPSGAGHAAGPGETHERCT